MGVERKRKYSEVEIHDIGSYNDIDSIAFLSIQ